MAKFHKRLIVGVAVVMAVGAAMIGSLTLIGSASSAGAEVTDNVRLVEDRRLPEQWVINAAYGRGALSNLRAALSEIENDNAEEARKGIAVAHSLLVKIKPESLGSATESATEGSSPHAAGSEEDLILVHSEVRVLGDPDPSNSVQLKLDGIRGEFAMNDHEAIIAALDSLNLPLAYTRVDLPLNETVILVNESLEALDSNDTVEARSKLLEIGDGLRIETVEVGIKAEASDPEITDDAG
jgi:hypothetical protein